MLHKLKTKTLSFLLLLFALSFVANCGGAISVKDTKEIAEKKTGFYIYANHPWLQWILFFTDGIMVKIGSKELTIVPWRTLEFIEHNPGTIPYSLKMTYGSGKKEGCLNLKKGSIIYIKYKSPVFVTSEGNVSFEDVVTGSSDGLEVPCK